MHGMCAVCNLARPVTMCRSVEERTVLRIPAKTARSSPARTMRYANGTDRQKGKTQQRMQIKS